MFGAEGGRHRVVLAFLYRSYGLRFVWFWRLEITVTAPTVVLSHRAKIGGQETLCDNFVVRASRTRVMLTCLVPFVA
eukprot:7119404-Prymnesium_polylepis.1